MSCFKQGKFITSQTQSIVLKRYEDLKKDYPTWKEEKLHYTIRQEIGISGTSLTRILKRKREGLSLVDGPQKRSRAKPVTGVDNFTMEAMARIVFKFHSEGRHATIELLLQEMKAEDVFHGSQSSLRRIIVKMGFRWMTADNRVRLMEQKTIVLKRIEFLQRYKQNRKPVIFLDETWIFVNGTGVKTWVKPNTVESVPKRPVSEGQRCIVLHAGSKVGFVPDADLLFVTGASAKQDYHGSMNSQNFKRWVEQKLLPGIRKQHNEPCLIIMDNASYHSVEVDKQPVTGWRKDQILDWLKNHGIWAPPEAKKDELLLLAKQNGRAEKRYEIDELLRGSGHTVLRLPPYHCHFNAIELVWGLAKQYYNKNIIQGTGRGTQRCTEVWKEALDKEEEEGS